VAAMNAPTNIAPANNRRNNVAAMNAPPLAPSPYSAPSAPISEPTIGPVSRRMNGGKRRSTRRRHRSRSIPRRRR
jgi:hypothetical protein